MKRWVSTAVVACMMAAAAPAGASIISFDAINLAGSTWRYDYQLANDSLPTAVDEFTIYFDLALYANLRDATGPQSWDLLTIQPDSSLPDDGFFDGLALAGGIEPGATLGTFSILFEYLGGDTPGSQRFEFLDAATFTVLESGNTTPRVTGPTPVPEPSTLALVISGLALSGVARLRRRRAIP